MRAALAAAVALFALAGACQAQDQDPSGSPRGGSAAPAFYFGADLSYVNEMEDCGAVYREKGVKQDAYRLFARHGTNLVRVRLWNDPSGWTKYSDLKDVKETISRARAAGMQVLLDFHYSDTWADGEKQITPKAWADLKSTGALADALYRFTYDTLTALDREGLMPEMVQVGNETNSALLGSKKGDPIDWTRNAALFNAGLKAVHDAGATSRIKPLTMLHIAQPENAEPWFRAARAAGLTDYDIIGLSYYRKWSTRSMAEYGRTVARLKRDFGKDVILVETAYPWTRDNADRAPNLLGEDAVEPGFPASPKGQLDYLVRLTQTTMDVGGKGVVYWEPAWVSTRCTTPWARGSGWDNATFFDFNRRNELLPGIGFMQHAYMQPPK